MCLLIQLPFELIVRVLDYIPRDHLLSLLNVNAYLDTIIIHHLFPVASIDYIDPHHHKHYILDSKGVVYGNGKVTFKHVSSFIKFCCRFKYTPRRIVIQDVCDFLQLHVQYDHVLKCVGKIEVRTDTSRDMPGLEVNLRQILSLGYENLYCLRLNKELSWDGMFIPECTKEMEVYFNQDYSPLVPETVENLQVHGIKLENVRQLPGNLQQLQILGLANYEFRTQTVSFPPLLTQLTLFEHPLVLNSIDISYLDYLAKFDYHGSLHTNEIVSLTQVKLPISLKSLTLTSLKLEDLYSLENYTNLEKLVIVECPVFHHFFTDTIFPHSLKSLTYGPNQCVQVNEVFARKAVEYPDQYHNSHFIVDGKFRLPQLKYLHLENLPFIRIIASKFTLPNSLNRVVLRNIGGFMDKLSNLILPLNLYSLTLRDASIEFINDMKFPYKLHHLNISKNFLTSIEGTNLSQLKYLQDVDFSYNKFTTTSTFINNLPQELTRLNLHGNKLNKCILKDLYLQTLEVEFSSSQYIVGNDSFILPKDIKTLQFWACSNIKFDWFIEFPGSLRNIEIHQLKSSRIILNNGNFFSKLPSGLHTLKIHDVVIIEEQPIRFPFELQNLSISCSFNQELIDRIDISSCNHLKSITLSGGHVQYFNLDKIPPTSIERITLQNMGLCQILGSFTNFPKLKHINLEKNNLSKSLRQLTLPNSLFTLILNKNNLDNLSIAIDNCSRLKFVFLERNPKLEQCVLQLMSLADKLYCISNEFGAIYLSSPTKIINSSLFQEKFDYFDKIIKDADVL
ncbi:uncharacterized protein SPAPADRAFT_50634 [Spathaspora passalidarum NRRL Y-27907]|uniref:F-box domain-containing protein n=1 Tax=Spathaspora passalidarum (strain NRRL Y-27907 / 11-Y1) TaxID=619300 RepID=G3AP06_SPAPN|nr:uncharacterized protein SPAPADRAFT_50634 [Spathaspora passalidarum NRRL Y-27907]EGW32037.1 hypothetical protein SPAPADRAFT_50634 [Spathaspora passalidarum NRRL Y-27907]